MKTVTEMITHNKLNVQLNTSWRCNYTAGEVEIDAVLQVTENNDDPHATFYHSPSCVGLEIYLLLGVQLKKKWQKCFS